MHQASHRRKRFPQPVAPGQGPRHLLLALPYRAHEPLDPHWARPNRNLGRPLQLSQHRPLLPGDLLLPLAPSSRRWVPGLRPRRLPLPRLLSFPALPRNGAAGIVYLHKGICCPTKMDSGGK